MSAQYDFGQALIEETRRRLLGESLPRLRRCLDLIDEQTLWRRPNEQTVSVGNLVLHLCGNARQWIVSGLGGAPDHRQRQAEFDEPGPIPKQVLIEKLEATMNDVAKVLDGVDPATLLEKRPVQVYKDSGLSILIHVVEHFSYHVGQISYVVKLTQNVDLGYYAGRNLEITEDQL